MTDGVLNAGRVARVVLLACGSYNPITNMHLRMFGMFLETLGAFFFNGPGPGQARARVQPFFFAAPAGPGGRKLARPLGAFFFDGPGRPGAGFVT